MSPREIARDLASDALNMNLAALAHAEHYGLRTDCARAAVRAHRGMLDNLTMELEQERAARTRAVAEVARGTDEDGDQIPF